MSYVLAFVPWGRILLQIFSSIARMNESKAADFKSSVVVPKRIRLQLPASFEDLGTGQASSAN